ncbi:MAG: ATP synthase F0 subunit C [Candidatus Babeliales bacterium]|jgi:F0F1-type ATP synthase membrane subunit c/vacuolar-type H+-ATPase subunit K
MILAHFLHYFSAVITIVLGAMGGGIAQGLAGSASIESLLRQSLGSDESSRAMIVGLALIESGVIIALVTTLTTLISIENLSTQAMGFAELGVALAVGFAALSISIASSMVVRACTNSISRQPLFAPKIFAFMLLTQSIIEAPVIFAFILGFVIKTNANIAMPDVQGLKLLCAGLLFAIGCLGPSIGQAIFAHAACSSIGINKHAYNKIFPFTLICEAVIETPVIFCLLLAIVISYTNIPIALLDSLAPFYVILSAVFCLAFGALGAAISTGKISAKSCTQIATNESSYGTMMRANLLTVAFIESTLIYTLIISLLLVTKVPSLLVCLK